MLKWYEQVDENSDVIISSRIRLARNFEKYPFSPKLKAEQAKQMVEEAIHSIHEIKELSPYELCQYKLSELTDNDKLAFVEKHVISPLFADKKQEAGVLLSKDQCISIMINEEDHIRIQCLTGLMDMKKVFKKANEIDDFIYDKLKFAYDEQYGYLTACPTNVGTGLRASYMVFLPALTSSKKMNKLVAEVSKYGVTIRGLYGEGSKSLGSIYQISNQKTLGISENDIIDNLNNIVVQVMKQERKNREQLLMSNYNQIEDQIFRSYGILKYAKQINSNDAMTLLAQIKFGIDSKIIQIKGDYNIHHMMMNIQPGNLQRIVGKNVGSIERDRYRAEYINNHLPDII